MEEIKKNKFLIIIFVIILGISFYLIYLNNDDNKDFYGNPNYELKHYEENEYIPVNITYDKVVSIYLQDFVYKILYKREEAYNKLDEEYRKVKFPTYESFDSYVKNFLISLKFQEMKVSKYAVTDTKDYRDFDVYDAANNLFIFREKGVMQYTVLFDRYTV